MTMNKYLKNISIAAIIISCSKLLFTAIADTNHHSLPPQGQAKYNKIVEAENWRLIPD